jgi:hypothetical protein
MVEFTSRFLFTLMFYCHHLFDLSYLFAIYISLQTECSWNISPTYATIGVNPPDLGMCAQIICSRANWRLANQEVLYFCLQGRMVARGWAWNSTGLSELRLFPFFIFECICSVIIFTWIVFLFGILLCLLHQLQKYHLFRREVTLFVRPFMLIYYSWPGILKTKPK